MIWEAEFFFLELGLGEVTSQCTQRLPEFSQIFRRRIQMNFIKFGKDGPNLQQVQFEIFELETSGSSWILVEGSKD